MHGGLGAARHARHSPTAMSLLFTRTCPALLAHLPFLQAWPRYKDTESGWICPAYRPLFNKHKFKAESVVIEGTVSGFQCHFLKH